MNTAESTPHALSTGAEPTDSTSGAGLVFWALLTATFLAALATAPFILDVMSQVGGASAGGSEATGLRAGAMVGVFLMISLLTSGALSAVAAGIGLWLAPRTGLGAPLLECWLLRRPVPAPVLRAAFSSAVVVGLVVGVFLTVATVVAERAFPVLSSPQLDLPPAWSMLLASLGQAVQLEIWMRLGVMGVLVGGLTILARRARPAPWTIWAGNLGAALVSGLVHLVDFQILGTGPLDPPAVAYVLAYTALAGLVFGWLFWRHGLLAAMAGNFVAHLVVRVVAPQIPGF